MAKTKQKELSFTEIGFLCLVMSALSTTFFSLPLYTYFFNFLGFGGIAYDIMNRKNRKHDQWFKDRGLNIDDRCPRLVERKETPYGCILKFIKPHAITSEDFQKNSVALNEYFGDGKGDVIVNYVNGFVFVELHNKELGKMYEYKNVDPERLKTKGILEVPLGFSHYDILTLDILKAPHVLIGGTTGGGKSSILRLIITFILIVKCKLYKIHMHLVDLKGGVEFSLFKKHPNVKTFAKTVDEARDIIQELTIMCDERFERLEKADCKDIQAYNKKFRKNPMSYEILVIDEFVDLVKDDCIEDLIVLTSKARACGCHAIIATQRPCSKTLDSRIKSNLDTVIGFKTSTRKTSEVVIDQTGLEKLRGDGNALIRAKELKGELMEIQCILLDDDIAKQLINESITEIKGGSPEVAATKTHIISNRRKTTVNSFLSKKDGGEGVKAKDIDKPKTTPPSTHKELKGKDIGILKALDKLVGGGDDSKQ